MCRHSSSACTVAEIRLVHLSHTQLAIHTPTQVHSEQPWEIEAVDYINTLSTQYYSHL